MGRFIVAMTNQKKNRSMTGRIESVRVQSD